MKSVLVCITSFFLWSCSDGNLPLEKSLLEADIGALVKSTLSVESDSVNICQEIAFESLVKDTIRLANGLQLSKVNEQYVCGDILLSDKQVELLAKKNVSRGVSISELSQIWQDKVVYFVFASNVSLEDQNIIYDAMYEWENACNILFRVGQGSGDYIEIIIGNGSYSNLGRIGGKQTLSLSIAGWNKGTVMHELGHALGMLHEHQHPMRDNYIIVNERNIQIPARDQFDIWPYGYASSKFDFDSIMMYGSYAYSRNNQPTMTKKDGTTWTANRSYITFNDQLVVMNLYGHYLPPGPIG